MIKKLNNYQIESRATAQLYTPLDSFTIFTMGTSGEGGEILDHIKKHVGHGHPLDIKVLIKESGDGLWYGGRVADLLDLELGKVWTTANYTPHLTTYKGSDFSALHHATVDTLSLIDCASANMLKYSRHMLRPGGMDGFNKRMIAAEFVDFISGLKALLKLYNIDVLEVVKVNTAKLKKRYDGNFSTEASMARVDVRSEEARYAVKHFRG